MCILLKLHSANFDVSRLFCSKVIKEKPLGVSSTPLVKEGLNSAWRDRSFQGSCLALNFLGTSPSFKCVALLFSKLLAKTSQLVENSPPLVFIELNNH